VASLVLLRAIVRDFQYESKASLNLSEEIMLLGLRLDFNLARRQMLYFLQSTKK
jgi:hypothetical protein